MLGILICLSAVMFTVFIQQSTLKIIGGAGICAGLVLFVTGYIMWQNKRIPRKPCLARRGALQEPGITSSSTHTAHGHRIPVNVYPATTVYQTPPTSNQPYGFLPPSSNFIARPTAQHSPPPFNANDCQHIVPCCPSRQNEANESAPPSYEECVAKL